MAVGASAVGTAAVLMPKLPVSLPATAMVLSLARRRLSASLPLLLPVTEAPPDTVRLPRTNMPPPPTVAVLPVILPPARVHLPLVST